MIVIPEEPQTRSEVALLLSTADSTLRDAINRHNIPTHSERRRAGRGFRSVTVVRPQDIRRLARDIGLEVADPMEAPEPTPVPETEMIRRESTPNQHPPETHVPPIVGETRQTHFLIQIHIPRDWPRRSLSALARALLFALRHLAGTVYGILWSAWWIVRTAANLILWLHVPPALYDWLCEDTPRRQTNA